MTTATIASPAMNPEASGVRLRSALSRELRSQITLMIEPSAIENTALASGFIAGEAIVAVVIPILVVLHLVRLQP